MATVQLKKKVIAAMDDLPEKKMREVLDFVSYLKLKEDEWFIDFVNKRGASAKEEKRTGRKLARLEDLQKAYR
jgi:hypothetical protein